VWALSKEMQRLGHTVTVLIPYPGSPVSEEYEYDGIRVIRYAEPTVADREFLRSRRAPDGLPVFLTFVREIGPSVVHMHEFNWSNGITLHHFEALKAMGIPVVLTFHLAGYTCRTGRLMYMGKEMCDGIIRPARCAKCSLDDSLPNKAMARLLYLASLPFYGLGIHTAKWNSRLGTSLSFPYLIEDLKSSLERLTGVTDRIIVLTRWYKKMLLENGVPEGKLTYIRQGLPYGELQHRRTARRNGGTIRLAFLGRIDPFKGLHLLLQALSGLTPGRISLDIYGQVVDESYYQRCLELTGPNGGVEWKGIISPEEVIPLLTTYDALCLPSTFSEMSPLVIEEAFAAGIPVIGSNVYGIAERVRHGQNGLLFAFNDAGSLQQNLQRLIDEQGLLEQLTAKVAEPAVFSEIASATNDVYENLVKKHLSKIE